MVGQESYRTDVRVENDSGSAKSFKVYRAGDCFLENSDAGFGRVDAATGAVACINGVLVGGNRVPGNRIEQFLPLTGGSSYREAGYNEIWAHVGSRQLFDNTCRCDQYIDNGMGLSWPLSIATGASAEVKSLLTFSPLGVVPLVTAKTADASTVAPQAQAGFTITISNPNETAVTLERDHRHAARGLLVRRGIDDGRDGERPGDRRPGPDLERPLHGPGRRLRVAALLGALLGHAGRLRQQRGRRCRRRRGRGRKRRHHRGRPAGRLGRRRLRSPRATPARRTRPSRSALDQATSSPSRWTSRPGRDGDRRPSHDPAIGSGFVTRAGDQLSLDGRPYRFAA